MACGREGDNGGDEGKSNITITKTKIPHPSAGIRDDKLWKASAKRCHSGESRDPEQWHLINEFLGFGFHLTT
jgi:hypothetical protein